MVKIVDLALRAVINSFEIYTINSLTEKKIETSCITSKVLFALAQLKCKNTIIIIIIKKASSRSCKSYFQ